MKTLLLHVGDKVLAGLALLWRGIRILTAMPFYGIAAGLVLLAVWIDPRV